MEPLCREQITENKNQLINLIDFDVLRPKLSETGIFTDEMLDIIYTAGPTLADRNGMLLSSLPKRGPKAYETFVKCLVDSGHLSAARILHPAIPQEGLWDGIVKPSQGPVIADETVYPMFAKPRGLALVISNTVFDDSESLKDRIGGEIDEENLKRLFGYLGFEVVFHQNKSAEDIETIITDFRNDFRHEHANACIVAILSHGSFLGAYGTDGKEVPNETILVKFNNVNCHLLRNKPKIFFLQHCRGDDPDIAIPQRQPHRRHEVVYPDSRGTLSRDDNLPTLPAWSDCIICYSTSPNYTSLRSHESGTWFIRVLVEVFSEKAHQMHLESMLREVTNRMLQLDSIDGHKQSPEAKVRGWRRKLYFNPGIYR